MLSTKTYSYNTYDRKSDRVERAAQKYLSLALYKEYCECMLSIGKNDAALAVAPAVSYAYWK
jgi:hypothetical protein